MIRKVKIPTTRPAPPLTPITFDVSDLNVLTAPQLMLLAFTRSAKLRKDLIKTRDKILAFPDSYDQNTWGRRPEGNENPPCNTVACLAGEYALVRGCRLQRQQNASFPTFSHKGVTVFPAPFFREGVLTVLRVGRYSPAANQLEPHFDALFEEGANGWPWEFRDAFGAARTRTQRARVAADRLDHFLVTGE